MNTAPPESHGDESGDTPSGASDIPGTPGPVRWSGLLRGLGAVSKVIDKVLAAICIVTFVFLVIVVSWQVFTREVLQNSAPWTTEAAQYTFVVLAIFAAAYVFSERGHIAVEILIEKLPQRLQRMMGIIIELVVIFFIVFVFVIGGSLVTQSAWTQDISSLPLTVGQVFLVMPIAGALILFYAVSNIIGILAGVEKPMPDFDENAEAI